jgi:hypothetical protein
VVGSHGGVTARQVPKKMIGRVLPQKEAEALLARF